MDFSRQRLGRIEARALVSLRRDTVDGEVLSVSWMPGRFDEQSQGAGLFCTRCEIYFGTLRS
jgi:hypothetical protein